MSRTKYVSAFGRRLKKERRRSGMTIRELGEKSKLSNAFICQLETGHSRNPGILTTIGLAKALKVRPAWLAWGEPK